MELALFVDDPRWKPDDVYLTVGVFQMLPNQMQNYVFGARDTIIARCAAQLANGPPKAAQSRDAVCELNQHASVIGWCHRCGLCPNTFTLFVSPVDELSLAHYTAELRSETGTHGHIANVRTNDSQQIVDVRQKSSLLRSMSGVGADALNTGLTCVSGEEWDSALKEARARILYNVPMANLSTGYLRIAARTDIVKKFEELTFTITAKCIVLRK